jgi:hypothetical protein
METPKKEYQPGEGSEVEVPPETVVEEGSGDYVEEGADEDDEAVADNRSDN